MAKPTPTRTTNPIHFEDLDPKRFEDLVRQLVYDFRNWSRLEATGRAGSDDGFDARAVEIVQLAAAQRDEDEEGEGASEVPPAEAGRLWLIQCKRERSISPKKMAEYMDGLRETVAAEKVHGIVFAAACDFSKKAHDVFFEKAREIGLQEAYLWGKGELEDQLYQPKNDSLLFAYFGISLATRRRSLKTDVRAMLATKRKATKLLNAFQPVLIRDATDDRYPYLDRDKTRDRYDRGRWRVATYDGLCSEGLKILNRRFFAWIGPDGKSWDAIEAVNHAIRDQPFENPWSEITEEERQQANALEHAARMAWDALPDDEQAWWEVHVVIPWEAVLDIDETGDGEFVRMPVIYTTEFIAGRAGPFTSFRESLATKSTFGGRAAAVRKATRIAKFPTKKELEKQAKEWLTRGRGGIPIED